MYGLKAVPFNSTHNGRRFLKGTGSSPYITSLKGTALKAADRER
jgi:hypothetical protein